MIRLDWHPSLERGALSTASKSLCTMFPLRETDRARGRPATVRYGRRRMKTKRKEIKKRERPADKRGKERPSSVCVCVWSVAASMVSPGFPSIRIPIGRRVGIPISNSDKGRKKE